MGIMPHKVWSGKAYSELWVGYLGGQSKPASQELSRNYSGSCITKAHPSIGDNLQQPEKQEHTAQPEGSSLGGRVSFQVVGRLLFAASRQLLWSQWLLSSSAFFLQGTTLSFYYLLWTWQSAMPNKPVSASQSPVVSGVLGNAGFFYGCWGLNSCPHAVQSLSHLRSHRKALVSLLFAEIC